MNVFDIISLLGGLAMFLYGMRMMGNGLKEGSSGTLKKIMEKVTNNVFTAFLLGVAVTALIQSSTATIVITSGLVGAGIITLHQSLGILVGANVGTTVTGQIIRLLDINGESAAWLQALKPSTLAPVALVLGIILIMGFKSKKAELTGSIAIGFGILFSGLLTMTDSVSALNANGALDNLFASVDGSPVLGYAIGAAVAFILQSSSATIGILQAFAMTGALTFRGIYAVLGGIYLGDCVTTAIVCAIGAKADARRVGIVNILFNLGKTAIVLVSVTLLHQFGVLDGIWAKTITSGGIANTNTIFNIVCALALLPVISVFEKFSFKIVKDKPEPQSPYADKLTALDAKFFASPALAFKSCYDALIAMYEAARTNIDKAYAMLTDYDEKVFNEIAAEEENIDVFADRISDYLVRFSPHIKNDDNSQILNQYYKLISEFERLGDHAVNISEAAQTLALAGDKFSDAAVKELSILKNLMNQLLDYTYQAFLKRDEDAAKHIEPLEEVMDDVIDTLRNNHLVRLSRGECSITTDNVLPNLLGDIERISDICSNVGLAVLIRVNPSIGDRTHDYTAQLHSGSDTEYNRVYQDARTMYMNLLTKE